MLSKRSALFLIWSLGLRTIAVAENGEAHYRAADDYSRVRRGLALLVVQDDRVIFESYQGAVTEPHPIYSGTKGFWVLAALVAVKEHILSLNDPVSDTITEWKADAQKVRITIRQLLNFTDGIEPASFLHGDVRDRNGTAIALPLVAVPGTHFLYGPSHLQIFGELLLRKLAARNSTPFAYLKSKVLNPLGLDDVMPKVDALGQPLLATGFKLTARQWARVGSLILHQGSYHGVQIVPAALLQECFHPSAANPSFGLGFWLNREAASPKAREPDIENLLELKWNQADWNHVCISRAAPADMVVALGSGYQRLYVIPSLNIVVVRQGLDSKFSDTAFLRLVFGR